MLQVQVASPQTLQKQVVVLQTQTEALQEQVVELEQQAVEFAAIVRLIY